MELRLRCPRRMYVWWSDNVSSLFLFALLIGMSSVCFCSSMSPANVSRSNDGAIGAMLTAVFAIAAGISAVDVAVGTTVDSTLLSMGCF